MNIEDLKLILLDNNLEKLSDSLNKFDIEEQDKFGNNILHYYLKHANDLNFKPNDIINLFQKKGLDLNSKQEKGKFGYAPIHLAVLNNLKDAFNVLLKKKINQNIQDQNGNTPLYFAVFNYIKDPVSYEYYIKELFKAKANPDLKNNYDVSPKSLANTIANADVRKFF